MSAPIVTEPVTADMTVGAKYITDVRAACVSDIRRLVQDQSARLLKCTLDIGEKLTQLREQCRARQSALDIALSERRL